MVEQSILPSGSLSVCVFHTGLAGEDVVNKHGKMYVARYNDGPSLSW